jgi:spore maturation protein CgeB
MKLVIFGLTMSSSWGNGHATLWRGLTRGLGELGHRIVFFEKDVPYYAAHRDRTDFPGVELRLYQAWEEDLPAIRRELSDADVGMVTSYCPDAIAASDLVLSSAAELKIFYDLDTPVTLDELKRGKSIDYIGPRGLGDFDLVLSYTGGTALEELRQRLGAREVQPLYGSVDPQTHFPVTARDTYCSNLSYLGTYASDRQAALETFFVEPARHLPLQKFLLGGAQYPDAFPWAENIYFVRHLPPAEHPAFFSSSRLTLNITRAAMAQMGFCPSGRLFEAAACGVPMVSDIWQGLDHFFALGSEILPACDTEDVMNALTLSDAELRNVALAARERVLTEHTARKRAEQLENLLATTAAARSNIEPMSV